MTEKELMLAGELYDSRDPELIARYQFVRNILSKINGYPLISMIEKKSVFSTSW
jgi:maltose O-acetyltransferase